jgi:hypothetical protein
MDKKFLYGIFFLLLVVIVLGALYLFHYRIKSLEASKLQLQKHILYHQQIIERYNQLLGNNNITEQIRNVPISQSPPPPIQMQAEHREVQREPQPQPQPQQQGQNPLGGMNVGNILPMMSSIMSMMSPSETSVVDNINEEDKENDDKKELENELEDELKELQDSLREEVSEGRVDDIKVEPKSDLREVASVSSEKSVVSVDSDYSTDSINTTDKVLVDEK